jgi:hypothetical protein
MIGSRDEDTYCHPLSKSYFDFNQQYGDLLPIS